MAFKIHFEQHDIKLLSQTIVGRMQFGVRSARDYEMCVKIA